MRVNIRAPMREHDREIKIHSLNLSRFEIPRIGESIHSRQGSEVIKGVVEDVARSYDNGELIEVVVILKRD